MDGVGKKNHLASKIPRLSPFFSIMIKNMAFQNFCQKKEGGGDTNIILNALWSKL